MREPKDALPLRTNAAEPLLVVGSVAYDNIETAYGRGDYILGGSASYASIAASYFAQPRLVGVVGKNFAEQDVARLQTRGVDLDGLQRDESGDTFFWAGKYSEDFSSRETLTTELNVFEKFNPELPKAYRKTKFVLLGNILPQLQARVLAQLDDPGGAFVLADTFELWINTQREALVELLPRVDVLAINDSEARLLTGEKDAIVAGRKLVGPEYGLKMLLLKKGEHGSLLFHPEGLFALPAYPVTELRDPTGAGDSYAGAILGYLAAQGTSEFGAIKRAMVYGAAVASLTVEAFGCDRLESAGADAIEARYDELVRMVSFT